MWLINGTGTMDSKSYQLVLIIINLVMKSWVLEKDPWSYRTATKKYSAI
jgi:hypothetical protein